MRRRSSLLWALAASLALVGAAVAADRKPLGLVNVDAEGKPTSHPGQFQPGDTVPVANGGTSSTTFTGHCVLIGEGASAFHVACPSSAGQVLLDNGASADPSFGPPAANSFALSSLAQIGADTILGNFSGSTANVAANAITDCPDSAGNHLNYSTSSHTLTCGNTSSGGGGGSGQHEYEAFGALPTTSTFGTTINHISSSLTNGTLSLFASWTSSGSNQLELYLQSAPATTPWDVYMRFKAHLVNTNDQFGLAVRNSTSAKVISFGQNYSQIESVQNWTSATTFSSNAYTAFVPEKFPSWLRIHDDGTNLTFYSSMDGTSWFQVTSVALATFIGSVDQVGIYCDCDHAGAAWVGSYSTAAPS